MKIKDICTFVTDGSHNPPQGIEKSEYMMLSSKNIFDDEITFDEPRFLSQKDFEREHKRTKIVVGDVLLTIVGTVGRTAVVDEDMPTFALQRSVAVLHPKNDVCLPRFLMYALRGKRTYIENRAKGVAQKGIYLKEVSDIDIYIPDISNQEIIINKLDKVNAVIKFRQEELLALDNLIKARFIELFGDPISEKLYKTKTIGEIGEVFTGTTPSTKKEEYYENKDILFIKPGDISENKVCIVDKAENYISDKAKKVARIFPKGSVLVTCIGIIGKIGIAEYESSCNQQINVIVPSPTVDSTYLAYNLLLVRSNLQDAANAPVVPILNKTDFSKVEVMVPPYERQCEFATFVEQSDKSKVAVLKIF